MAYSLTPPQPITGDDQHLLAEEKQYEKKKKTEKYLERSEEFLRGQLVKTYLFCQDQQSLYSSGPARGVIEFVSKRRQFKRCFT